MQLFENYEKVSKETKVLMLYLILNDCPLERVSRLEEVEENRAFGLKLKKVYGLTEDILDVQSYYREIESIQNPIICSRTSYEYYADAPFIYHYKPKDEDNPLVINDMGIISKTMVIEDDFIVSDNAASPFLSDEAVNGFPYFKEYVLRNQCTVGAWTISFAKNIFTIKYKDEILYSAIEIDKTSTYKMVIYIIRKVSPKEDCVSDNFVSERYGRRSNETA